MTSVRYIVDDPARTAEFYVGHLGFRIDFQVPGFARLTRDDLVLLLNAPGAGGAGQPADDGRVPAPGGWNRFQLEVEDLAAMVAGLEAAGCPFRTSLVEGQGGKQALVEDPAGNLVELFQPAPA